MTMTDPIADLLTRIRNAVRISRETVDVPKSKMKVGVLDVLQREGYIVGYDVLETTPVATIRVELKYGPEGEPAIGHIQRASRPGRRVYEAAKAVPTVRDGLGISIVTTNRGILSDRECRREKVGGEVLCTIW